MRAWPIVGGVAIVASCTVSEIDLEGKRCPCADGWTCIEATQLCVLGGDAGGKGGDASAKGGTGGGTGGSAATGGRPDSGLGGISSGGQAGNPSGGSAGISSGGVTSGGGGVPSGGGGVSGSCVGYCNTSSPSGCYCDAACLEFGDCCGDYISACGGSCSGLFKDCAGQCVLKSGQNGCSATDCTACPSAPNATANCSGIGSTCGTLCNPGFGDCDQTAPGCETDVTVINNCGKCARTCATTNASGVSCTAGACVATCTAGYGNCNELLKPSPDDGCETQLGTATNCASCGNNCTVQGGIAKFTCMSGACGCSSVTQCQGDNNVTASCDLTTHRCKCGATLCAAGQYCTKQQGLVKCT